MKWAILNAALDVLEITVKEQQSRKKHSSTPTEMFCSTTTLKALTEAELLKLRNVSQTDSKKSKRSASKRS